jgi:hypothetical protein
MIYILAPRPKAQAQLSTTKKRGVSPFADRQTAVPNGDKAGKRPFSITGRYALNCIVYQSPPELLIGDYHTFSAQIEGYGDLGGQGIGGCKGEQQRTCPRSRPQARP